MTAEGVRWNYTTWLNIVFLLLAMLLVIRFVRTGGIPMLRMMGGAPDAGHDHGGHDHVAHNHSGHDQVEHGGHSHPSPDHDDH
jgi:hypothetical protein